MQATATWKRRAAKAGSASARMNYSRLTTQLGKLQSAEAEFKRALEFEPKNYVAIHLGELYVRSGKLTGRYAVIEQAQRINLPLR